MSQTSRERSADASLPPGDDESAAPRPTGGSAPEAFSGTPAASRDASAARHGSQGEQPQEGKEVKVTPEVTASPPAEVHGIAEAEQCGSVGEGQSSHLPEDGDVEAVVVAEQRGGVVAADVEGELDEKGEARSDAAPPDAQQAADALRASPPRAASASSSEVEAAVGDASDAADVTAEVPAVVEEEGEKAAEEDEEVVGAPDQADQAVVPAEVEHQPKQEEARAASPSDAPVVTAAVPALAPPGGDGDVLTTHEQQPEQEVAQQEGQQHADSQPRAPSAEPEASQPADRSPRAPSAPAVAVAAAAVGVRAPSQPPAAAVVSAATEGRVRAEEENPPGEPEVAQRRSAPSTGMSVEAGEADAAVRVSKRKRSPESPLQPPEAVTTAASVEKQVPASTTQGGATQETAPPPGDGVPAGPAPPVGPRDASSARQEDEMRAMRHEQLVKVVVAAQQEAAALRRELQERTDAMEARALRLEARYVEKQRLATELAAQLADAMERIGSEESSSVRLQARCAALQHEPEALRLQVREVAAELELARSRCAALEVQVTELRRIATVEAAVHESHSPVARGAAGSGVAPSVTVEPCIGVAWSAAASAAAVPSEGAAAAAAAAEMEVEALAAAIAGSREALAAAIAGSREALQRSLDSAAGCAGGAAASDALPPPSWEDFAAKAAAAVRTVGAEAVKLAKRNAQLDAEAATFRAREAVFEAAVASAADSRLPLMIHCATEAGSLMPDELVDAPVGARASSALAQKSAQGITPGALPLQISEHEELLVLRAALTTMLQHAAEGKDGDSKGERPTRSDQCPVSSSKLTPHLLREALARCDTLRRQVLTLQAALRFVQATALSLAPHGPTTPDAPLQQSPAAAVESAVRGAVMAAADAAELERQLREATARNRLLAANSARWAAEAVRCRDALLDFSTTRAAAEARLPFAEAQLALAQAQLDAQASFSERLLAANEVLRHSVTEVGLLRGVLAKGLHSDAVVAAVAQLETQWASRWAERAVSFFDQRAVVDAHNATVRALEERLRMHATQLADAGAEREGRDAALLEHFAAMLLAADRAVAEATGMKEHSGGMPSSSAALRKLQLHARGRGPSCNDNAPPRLLPLIATDITSSTEIAAKAEMERVRADLEKLREAYESRIADLSEHISWAARQPGNEGAQRLQGLMQQLRASQTECEELRKQLTQAQAQQQLAMRRFQGLREQLTKREGEAGSGAAAAVQQQQQQQQQQQKAAAAAAEAAQRKISELEQQLAAAKLRADAADKGVEEESTKRRADVADLRRQVANAVTSAERASGDATVAKDALRVAEASIADLRAQLARSREELSSAKAQRAVPVASPLVPATDQPVPAGSAAPLLGSESASKTAASAALAPAQPQPQQATPEAAKASTSAPAAAPPPATTPPRVSGWGAAAAPATAGGGAAARPAAAAFGKQPGAASANLAFGSTARSPTAAGAPPVASGTGGFRPFAPSAAAQPTREPAGGPQLFGLPPGRATQQQQQQQQQQQRQHPQSSAQQAFPTAAAASWKAPAAPPATAGAGGRSADETAEAAGAETSAAAAADQGGFSSSTGTTPPLCYYFQQGRCAKGAMCHYHHPAPTAPVAATAVTTTPATQEPQPPAASAPPAGAAPAAGGGGGGAAPSLAPSSGFGFRSLGKARPMPFGAAPQQPAHSAQRREGEGGVFGGGFRAVMPSGASPEDGAVKKEEDDPSGSA